MKLQKFNTQEFLTRGVVKVIEKESLGKKLQRRKKLRVKHGIDPTTPDLHLGYAAVYEKLRALQEMGHTIVFIIGDFTGRFGDPTDTSGARPLRTRKEVQSIAKSYFKQLGHILDTKKTEVRYNSEWFDHMKAEEFLRLFSHFTVGRMLERDMFQERMKRRRDIRLHEPLYPALQAYDSVMIHSDITVIGTDQLFNELQARKLQEDFGQAPQDIVAVKMLVGLDGANKMSQSLGNYIGFTEPAREQYGKVMSLPDSQITSYFELVTRVNHSELKRLEKEISRRPREAKARLAREIVTIYHGSSAAGKAEEEFNNVFRKHHLPLSLPTKRLKKGTYTPSEFLVALGLTRSKSDAKRLIEQKAVKIDGEVLSDWRELFVFAKETVVQVGKRRFVKVAVKK